MTRAADGCRPEGTWVTDEMLAAYTGKSDPGGKFGWYRPDDSGDLNHLFTLPSTDVQKINEFSGALGVLDPLVDRAETLQLLHRLLRRLAN